MYLCTVSLLTPFWSAAPIRCSADPSLGGLRWSSPRSSALLQRNARGQADHNATNPSRIGRGTQKWQPRMCVGRADGRAPQPIQTAARACARALRGVFDGQRAPERCTLLSHPRLGLPPCPRSPHRPEICVHAVRDPRADQRARQVGGPSDAVVGLGHAQHAPEHADHRHGRRRQLLHQDFRRRRRAPRRLHLRRPELGHRRPAAAAAALPGVAAGGPVPAPKVCMRW